MTVNFRDLLKFSSETVERPKPLPEGHYNGIISRHEFGLSKKKQTPFVRFYLQLQEPTGDISPEQLNGIDLSKVELRKDFYITPKSAFMLTDLLDAVLGKDNRLADERLPETKGQRVMFGVAQRQNDDATATFNDVTTIVKI